jgi:G3E family GTPase
MTVRVPIIILTGFLGSGKTSLLNRLFRARPPARGRFAIIVNELGDVGIDGDLLPRGTTRQVELPGGCVCCALAEDLERTLIELLDQERDLGCILVETTGVADPMPIAWTIEGDPLRERARLAAVVTVVDPFAHEASRPVSPSVDAQVRYADVLVLSKLDAWQAEPARRAGTSLTELAATLRARNAQAPLIAAPPDEVPAVLWQVLEDPEFSTGAGRTAAATGEAIHDHHDADEGAHGLASVSIAADGVVDLEELVAALETLPADIVRMKGIVRAVDGESGSREAGWHVVHRVGARVSTEPYANAHLDGPEPTARIVAIGRRLDSARIAACFRSAMLTC